MSGWMQVLKKRGKSRRLQCHCGEKFWVNPEKGENVGEQENSMTAKCPKCECLWNGQDVEKLAENVKAAEEDMEAANPARPPRYHFRTAVQIGPNHWTPVSVGKAKHLPEYIARMVLDMPRTMPGVVFTLISKKEYDYDKKYIKEQQRHQMQTSDAPIMPPPPSMNGGSGFPPIFITGKNNPNEN